MTNDEITRWKRQVREISDWLYERQADGCWGAPRDEYDGAATRILSESKDATTPEECLEVIRSVFDLASADDPFPSDADGEWLLGYVQRGGLALEYRFDEVGALAVMIEGEPELARALNDAVTALAPAGTDPGLSTYWIESALSRIEQGVEEVASGNMSMLLRDGGNIKPFSDYTDWPDRTYPAVEITGLLRAWRGAVLRKDPGAASRWPHSSNPIILPPASDEPASR